MQQSADPVPAVLDSSFWINTVRMGLEAHLVRYFSLAATPRVVAELTVLLGEPQPPEAAVTFQDWHQRGLVAVLSPLGTSNRFDIGENEAIALAQERGWLLLIDNSAPRDWSRGPGNLQVVDSPAFAVLLYDQGHLAYHEVTSALSRSRAARRVVREALMLLGEIARQKGEVSR